MEGLFHLVEHLNKYAFGEGVGDLEGRFNEYLESSLDVLILDHLEHQELIVLRDNFKGLDFGRFLSRLGWLLL